MAFANTLSHALSIKLNQHNFLILKIMITLVIQGHKLDGHLLGTKPCTPEYIPLSIATIVSHGFALNLSFQLLGFTIFNEVWKSLERLFSSHLRLKSKQLVPPFKPLKKGIKPLKNI